MLPRATTPKPRSIPMPRATSPKSPSTTLRLRSTTRLRMLHQLTTPRLPSITQLPDTTPRLQLITPPKRLTTPSRLSTTPPRLQSITPQLMLPRATTPKPRSITLPRATQLRRSSITQPRLTTQRLLLRTTLNRNTTPRLQFTTPQPTVHLATTP
jgi:hypothetical protein